LPALDIGDEAGSCVGRCDAAPAAGACACDAACVAAGDCCSDACSACGACRCKPDCSGRACGPDGCGGRCGDCAPDQACAGGACVDDACAGVRCDACSACADGRCVALAEGAACEDGDPCTVRDTCRAGKCSGVALDCDDGFACTIDRCDAQSGECRHARNAACCDDDAGCPDGGAAGEGTQDAGRVKLAHHARTGGCDCAVARAAHGRGLAAATGALLAFMALRRRRRPDTRRTAASTPRTRASASSCSPSR
jgi:hypothetical protein